MGTEGEAKSPQGDGSSKWWAVPIMAGFLLISYLAFFTKIGGHVYLTLTVLLFVYGFLNALWVLLRALWMRLRRKPVGER